MSMAHKNDIAEAAIEWREAHKDFEVAGDVIGSFLRHRYDAATRNLIEAIEAYEEHLNERAAERADSDFYGGGGPVTQREQHEAAAKEKT